MKIKIQNYTFDASAKTVTFTDYASLELDQILLITNVTDNIVIYNFTQPALGGTIAINVLTLTYDTTSMADTDDLMIFIDDNVGNTLGDKSDTAASTDTGSFSIVAFFKRALQNWTTFLTQFNSIVKAEDSVHTSGDNGIVLLGIRNDSDASTAANGDYTVLKLDEEGRLKVASKPASYADVTGDITAIQATIGTPVVGGTVSGDVSRASNVVMFCSGTFSTVNVTFEGSLESTGDTNWFGIQSVRTNANTIETTTGNLSAAPAYAWELSVNALARVRVRCTARTSGTQSWRFKLGTYATEPIPAAQVSATQPVSGTVTANLGTGSIAAGSNAIGDVGIQYRSSSAAAGSPVVLSSPATPAAQALKGAAGRLFGVYVLNSNALTRYLKIFNTASPTLGTTSAILDIPIPPSNGGPVFINFEGGIPFTAAITAAITGGRGVTDNTAITLNDVTGFTLHA